MEPRKVGVRRAGFIVLGVGLVGLLPGLIAFGWSLAFVLRAERAEAVFRGAVEHNSSYGMMFYPQFGFRTAAGRDMTYVSPTGSSSQEYADGDRITVLYDPARPEHVEAAGMFGVWLPPVLLLPPALLLLAIAVFLLAL